MDATQIEGVLCYNTHASQMLAALLFQTNTLIECSYRTCLSATNTERTTCHMHTVSIHASDSDFSILTMNSISKRETRLVLLIACLSKER
eukprot:scaffold289776_cov21-Tisochrysis_lutea.AAC.1